MGINEWWLGLAGLWPCDTGSCLQLGKCAWAIIARSRTWQVLNEHSRPRPTLLSPYTRSVVRLFILTEDGHASTCRMYNLWSCRCSKPVVIASTWSPYDHSVGSGLWDSFMTQLLVSCCNCCHGDSWFHFGFHELFHLCTELYTNSFQVTHLVICLNKH